ncbi:MAG: geranylgeranylglycerol-phosphate geranylgeranyltransferase [Methanothrix sp.]|jgi:geranylgeranylglycerol-phosphate geranylgeranyltransferase|nr:geranylgeranylglycerol-phosphate geranylgeranyltransferase [Methanothrix sp.]
MGIEALRAFWEILRPLNCAMAGIAAVIGLAITSSQNLRILILIFLAVFLIAGAGNAVNDYYDRAIDAVNRPKRPIPSGRIGSQTALRYSLLLFAAGCIMAGVVNQICLGVAVLNSALLIFYARSLKATPLAGNICVAFLTGSTFLFGGGAAGVAGLLANKVPFFLSFLATMSREIMKDVEDIEGDRLGGAKTLPILAGARTASALAAAFAALAVALSFTAPFGMAYMAIVAVADLFFLASITIMARGDAAGSQRALKIGMAFALAAFLAGALHQMEIL